MTTETIARTTSFSIIGTEPVRLGLDLDDAKGPNNDWTPFVGLSGSKGRIRIHSDRNHAPDEVHGKVFSASVHTWTTKEGKRIATLRKRRDDDANIIIKIVLGQPQPIVIGEDRKIYQVANAYGGDVISRTDQDLLITALEGDIISMLLPCGGARMFEVEGGKPSEVELDTMGEVQLRIHDARCRLESIEPGDEERAQRILAGLINNLHYFKGWNPGQREARVEIVKFLVGIDEELGEKLQMKLLDLVFKKAAGTLYAVDRDLVDFLHGKELDPKVVELHAQDAREKRERDAERAKRDAKAAARREADARLRANMRGNGGGGKKEQKGSKR